MKVLGLSFGYHDSSAALVVDGKIAAASAEERYTRQKHDSSFPAFAVQECLRVAGLKISEVDKIIYHEDPHRKFIRVLTSALSGYPRTRQEFVQSMMSWLGKKLWSLDEIARRLEVSPKKIAYLSHHLSHAAQGFMGSGFEKAAIMIVDAVGDWSSTSTFLGEWKDGHPHLKKIDEVNFPHSLGLVYSAFTAYLGFSPNDNECSVMALAAFGEPKYEAQVRQMIHAEKDGFYSVQQKFFHFIRYYQGATSEEFHKLLGPPRKPEFRLAFSSLRPKQSDDPEQRRFADIAASIQKVYEDEVVKIAQSLYDRFALENLCFAGGGALNCVANSKIVKQTAFKNFFVPPDPGDGGTAIGAALYWAATHSNLSATKVRIDHPYFGGSCQAHKAEQMLSHFKPARINNYLKANLDKPLNPKWSIRRFENPDELCEITATKLSQGRIIGWVQSRFENGPRALGNRSILIKPDDVDLAEKMSRLVKDRASYRPYALSMTPQCADEILDWEEKEKSINRWMQYAVPIKESQIKRVRAGAHVDGTTRPQVCTEAENPLYFRLLRSFGSKSGIEVLLNTSFNESGYPLVNNEIDALVSFARTAMDVLVIDDLFIEKEVHP